jgi:3-methyladenine DNA glycosylase AlkD
MAKQSTRGPVPTVDALVAELRTMGSEPDRAGMARFGINVEKAFGVSVNALRAVAKRFPPDHALALALWETGLHEARVLATIVDDPAAVTEPQLERWAADFDSWDVCDGATTGLFDLSPFGWTKAVEWADRPEEYVRRGGFALMAGLASHDKAAGDAAFERLLPVIARGARDPRNYVKKAVSWALRNIGKRNLHLNAAAQACAERIRADADRRAGGERGGSPEDRAARWVAADVLRELRNPKQFARIREREGRPKGRR